MTINLSNHPQLFLDDYLVSRLRNLTRDVKQPVKHPSNPLFVSEHPWEKTCHWYTTVIYDEQWGKFRAWYMCGFRAGYKRPFPRASFGESVMSTQAGT